MLDLFYKIQFISNTRNSKKLQTWVPGEGMKREVVKWRKKKVQRVQKIALDQGQSANSYIIKIIT